MRDNYRIEDEVEKVKPVDKKIATLEAKVEFLTQEIAELKRATPPRRNTPSPYDLSSQADRYEEARLRRAGR